MFRKRTTATTVVLAILFGASSLLAQQSQPAGAVQAGTPSASEVMAKGRLDGTTAAQGVGTGGFRSPASRPPTSSNTRPDLATS